MSEIGIVLGLVVLMWGLSLRWALSVIVMITFVNLNVQGIDAATILIVMLFARTFTQAVPVARKSRFVTAFALYVAWAVLSLVWTSDQETALITLRALIRVLMAVTLVKYIIQDEKDIQAIVVGCMVGIVYSVLLTMRTIEGTTDEEVSRITLNGISINLFATQLVWAATLVLYFIIARLSKIDMLGRFVLIILYWGILWLPVVGSGSRAGIVGMLIAPILFLFQISPRVLVGGGAIVIMGVFFAADIFPKTISMDELPYASQDTLVRLNYTLSGRDDTHRTQIWRTGLVMGEHNVVLGVGIGSSPDNYAQYSRLVWNDPILRRYSGRALHNSFITSFAELGVLGLFLFLRTLWFWIVSVDVKIRQSLTLGSAYALLTVLSGMLHSFEQVTLLMILLALTNQIMIMSANATQEVIKPTHIALDFSGGFLGRNARAKRSQPQSGAGGQ